MLSIPAQFLTKAAIRKAFAEVFDKNAGMISDMKTTAALNAAAMHGHDAGAGGAGEIAAAAAAAGGGTAATGFNVVTITINGTKDLLKFGTTLSCRQSIN